MGPFCASRGAAFIAVHAIQLYLSALFPLEKRAYDGDIVRLLIKIPEGMMNSRVDVAVLIGSGVPATLQAVGQRVCWVVLVNGERRGTAFGSRKEALECQAAWLAQLHKGKAA